MGQAGTANANYCLSGYHSYFPVATGWVYGSESDPLFSGNGITDPIEPHFGTAADLHALVNAAHARGMRVLVDLVVNHVFADATPPMGQKAQLSPLWVAHQTDATWFNLPYNLNVNDCGHDNLWDTATTQMWNRENCWFDPFLPDFNTTSPTVDDEVTNHAVWMMEEFNLDGFRVDATKQVNNAICADLRGKVSAAISTNLPFYMVGEALGNVVDFVMDCVGADKLDGSVNDPLHNTIVSTFLSGSENGTSLDNDIMYDESTWSGRYSNALMGHFFGSHDVPRAISIAANDVGDQWNNKPPAQESNGNAFKRLQLAQAFLLTYDPIPILWMGDEFGQPGSSDPDNRRMMRFGGALSTNEQQTLTNLSKLGKARAAHSAFRRGTRTRLWVDGTFYAYGRVDGTDIVVAAFNLDPNNSVTHAVPVGNIGLSGSVTDALSGTSATVDGSKNLTITLAPLSGAVFTK
jgi:glycosidase